MDWDTDKSIAKRRAAWLLLTLLLVGLPRPVLAEQGPVEVLQTMTDTLIDLIRQDPDVIHDKVRLRVIANEVIFPRVDFNALSRWVLGKYWRSATPQQRTSFIAEFRKMILGTYLRSVSAYQDNGVRFLPSRGDREKGLAVVNAEIDQPDGPVVHVTFRMHQASNGWLIYDVAVEGISLVATHRSSFSRQIRNSGMDGLIEQLRARNVNTAREEAVTAPEVARN
jgi:phospholipid transport system substrate-binding protein